MKCLTIFVSKFTHMATAVLTKLTFDEYLEFEREAAERHEFIDGEIVEMTNTHPNHGLIAWNLGGLLTDVVKKSGGFIWSGDRLVYVRECEEGYYPDLVIVAGQPIHGTKKGMIYTKNPTILVEILSKSTASLDLQHKQRCYRYLPSLEKYFCIDHRTMFVHCYEKRPDNGIAWRYSSAEKPGDTISILGENIPLSLIYERVNFNLTIEED